MKVLPEQIVHPTDKAAMHAMESIPGFTAATKAFMKAFNEREQVIANLSSSVLITDKQLPHYHDLLVPICKKLGIKEPLLFLCESAEPNAWTYGDTRVCITMTTALIEHMNDEEVQVVLAHECGHIFCRHVLYHTMGTMLIEGGDVFLDIPSAVTAGLKLAYKAWERNSELTADRVAALFCEDPRLVSTVMMRLAGGTKHLSEQIDLDLFMQQAALYQGYLDGSKMNKAINALVLSKQDHPLLAVRAREIHKWCGTPEFANLVAQMHTPEPMVLEGPKCPHCGSEMSPGAIFCPRCGYRVEQAALPGGIGVTRVRQCTNCGAALSPVAAFCPICGQPVGQ